jgi:hypothetical protein
MRRSVFVRTDDEQMIGAATLNGAIHLLHASYTPISKLLQTKEALLEAMVANVDPSSSSRGAIPREMIPAYAILKKGAASG